jgi:hypothetical protein
MLLSVLEDKYQKSKNPYLQCVVWRFAFNGRILTLGHKNMSIPPHRMPSHFAVSTDASTIVRCDRRYTPQLWSGRRDSNPQHSAWEADALPIELRPHVVFLC